LEVEKEGLARRAEGMAPYLFRSKSISAVAKKICAPLAITSFSILVMIFMIAFLLLCLLACWLVCLFVCLFPS
jgi:hypothetical protein